MRSKITSAFQFLSRDCNRAVLSALSYSLSTTFLNVGNKVVFSLKEFDYPLGSIAFQNVISLFVLLIFIVVGLKERPQFHPGLARSLLLPNVCFSMFLYSNAKALRYINLPVLTVIKSFAPLVGYPLRFPLFSLPPSSCPPNLSPSLPFRSLYRCRPNSVPISLTFTVASLLTQVVSILEVVIFKDPLTTDTALCMVIVVASNYVTASNDVEFSLPGYVWAAVNVVSNVAYLLSLRKSLSDHYDMLTSAFHFTLISLIFIFPLSFIAGDFPHIIKSFLDTSQR